jgi:hypothetical protein
MAVLIVWLAAVRPAAGASAGTGRLVIGAAGFVPSTNSCQYSHGGLAGGDDPGILQDENRCSYIAPVFLPAGSVVTGVKLFYDSSDAGSRGTLQLSRHRPNGFFEDLAQVAAHVNCSAPCAVADMTISNPKIDNGLFHYDMRMYNGGGSAPGFRLMKVVILYNRP